MAQNFDFLKKENRPVQYFTKEYLAQCQKMSLEEIVQKIEEQKNLFWLMQGEDLGKSQLISLKIPQLMLENFKEKSRQSGVKYQTQIKKLMLAWLLGKDRFSNE